MLNASGKAKLFHRRGTSLIAGVHYHKDDRQSAIDGLKAMAPAGATIIAVEKGNNRADFYVLTAMSDGKIHAQYISKYAGSVVDLTIWDGAAINGVECGYRGSMGVVQDLGEALYGDAYAFRFQKLSY